MLPTITESGALYLAQHKETLDKIEVRQVKPQKWPLKPRRLTKLVDRARPLTFYRDNGR